MSNEKCPFCGSLATNTAEKISHKKVGWGDGLGSPGTIRIVEYKSDCKSCGRVWEPSTPS